MTITADNVLNQLRALTTETEKEETKRQSKQIREILLNEKISFIFRELMRTPGVSMVDLFAITLHLGYSLGQASQMEQMFKEKSL